MAGFGSSGVLSLMYVAAVAGVGVGVAEDGVAVGPPDVGVVVGVEGAAVTRGTTPVESSWKLLSEPLQIDQLERSPLGFRWLGMTAPICAVSPTPPANAGTEGAAKKLALRLKSRIDSRAAWSDVRSVAAKSFPPLLVAMQFRAGKNVGSEFNPTTYTGMPLTRTLGSIALAAARLPAMLSGSRTCPRSPAGPFPVKPPTQGSDEHSSWPSVTYTMM